MDLKIVTCMSVFAALLLAPANVNAEVDMSAGVITSGACPMDCDTKGLSRTVCKDWRKDGQCYVQDLRPEALQQKLAAEQKAEEALLERKVTSVERQLKVGDKVSVKTLNKPINRVDVVVKALSATSKPELNISFAGQGGATQAVDTTSLNSQVVRFDANGQNLEGKNIDVTALNSGVRVESVHVLYQ